MNFLKINKKYNSIVFELLGYRALYLMLLSILFSMIEFFAFSLLALIVYPNQDTGLNIFIKTLFEWLSMEDSYDNYLLFLMLAALAKIFITIRFNRFLVTFATSLVIEVRHRLMQCNVEQPLRNTGKVSTGEMSNILNKETEKVDQTIMLIGETCKRALSCISYIVVALLINYKIVLMITAILPIFYLFNLWVNKVVPVLSEKKLQSSNDVNQKTIDFLNVIETIKLLNHKTSIYRNFKATLVSYGNNKAKLEIIERLAKNLPEPIGLFSLGFIILLIIKTSDTNPLAVIIIAGVMFKTAVQLAGIQMIVVHFIGLSAPLNSILERIKDFKPYIENDGNVHGVENIVLKNIEIENNKNGIRVKELNFERGSIYLIKGESGIGKSSLLHFIAGLRKIKSGTIMLNNKIDFFNMEMKPKPKVSLVPQSYKYITGSIKENITMFSEETDNKRLEEALKLSRLSNFMSIKDLDKVYNASNEKLSGGQLQRLVLARSLYQKPEVLLLDEVTSGLDHLTEQEVMHTLKKVKKHMIVILASHNKYVENFCDKIYSMEKGTISVEK